MAIYTGTGAHTMATIHEEQTALNEIDVLMRQRAKGEITDYVALHAINHVLDKYKVSNWATQDCPLHNRCTGQVRIPE